MTTDPKPKYCHQQRLNIKRTEGGRLCEKKLIAVSLLLLLLLHFKHNACAQTPAVSEQTKSGKEAVKTPDKIIIKVKGVLQDKVTEEELPISGVYLKKGGNLIGFAETNLNGEFTISGNYTREKLTGATLDFTNFLSDYYPQTIYLDSIKNLEDFVIELTPTSVPITYKKEKQNINTLDSAKIQKRPSDNVTYSMCGYASYQAQLNHRHGPPIMLTRWQRFKLQIRNLFRSN